eukprot:6709759-Karenia_brevis.AAC.1
MTVATDKLCAYGIELTKIAKGNEEEEDDLGVFDEPPSREGEGAASSSAAGNAEFGGMAPEGNDVEQAPQEGGESGMLIDSMSHDEKIDSSLRDLQVAARTPVPPGSNSFLREIASAASREGSGDSRGSYAKVTGKGTPQSKSGSVSPPKGG